MFKPKVPQMAKVDKARYSLELNGNSVYPGVDLHSSHWAGLRKALKAKRLNVMEKRNLGAMWRETVYAVENPVFKAFEGKLEFGPRIHQFEKPPAAHLSENLWRTGAVICFYGGLLFRWIAQVAGDSEAAELFFNRAEIKVGGGIRTALPHRPGAGLESAPMGDDAQQGRGRGGPAPDLPPGPADQVDLSRESPRQGSGRLLGQSLLDEVFMRAAISRH